MRGSQLGRRAGTMVLATAIAVVGVISGAAPGGVTPAAADCGMQFPDTRIGPHRGFAFDGVIAAIDRLPEQSLERITMDVTEMLAGDPVEQVVFDLGRGACSFLQADRYKVGDRLIVTASAPPVDGEERHLPDALTWRYEWGDTWTFHGIPPQQVRRFSRPIRSAVTRTDILALVAPAALPFGVDPGIWSVALARPGSGIGLDEVVAFRGGFVALGTREAKRGQRRTDPDRPVVFVSDTGGSWTQVADPFPGVRGPDAYLERLVVFQDEVYALGRDQDALIAFVSADGRRWTKVLEQPLDHAGPSFEGGEVRFLTGITTAASATTLMVLGAPAGEAMPDETRVWTTFDGRAWTRSVPIGLRAYTDDLVATADGFAVRTCVCGSQVERWLLKTSTDGQAWTQAGEVPTETVDLAWDAVAGRYLAALRLSDPFDGDQAALAASSDGVTWTRLVTAPGITSVPTGVSVDGATIALLGTRRWDTVPTAWTMSSPDSGATWTYAELPRSARNDCVATTAAGEDGIVAVGRCSGTVAWVAPSGGAAP